MKETGNGVRGEGETLLARGDVHILQGHDADDDALLGRDVLDLEFPL